MLKVAEVETRCNKSTIWRQGHWSAHRLRPLEEAQAKTLVDTLGDVETRILVKTLAFKLQVVAEEVVDALCRVPRQQHFKTHKTVCRRKNYWTF